MYCTKCGKEIPDGENKLCNDCQKNLLNEIEENEKEVDENKNEKKVEKKFKIANKKCEKKNLKFAILFLLVLIVVFIGTVFFNNIINKSKVGNTIGNIRNYGYATEDGKYIYYLAPNESSTQIGIFKIEKDNKEAKPQELAMKEWDVLSLNVVGNEIYFIGILAENYKDDDTIDNKIYKMKTDGTDLEVINDNEFNNDCYEIYVANNEVYYIGVDSNIYKMKKDGSEKVIVSENGTGYLGITNEYIIYNAEIKDSTDYETHIMDLNGENTRPIIEKERLYSVNVDEDYIYYTNADKNICRVGIDGKNPEVICKTTAYNMNANGEYIYFMNYADAEKSDYTVCIYRIKKDGSTETPEKIKAMETYSSFIDIIGNWIIYMDSNETEGFINLVKTDGSEEIRLYTLNYEEYYSSIIGENPEENVTENSNEQNEEKQNTSAEVENKSEDITNTVVAEKDKNNVVNENVESSNTNTVSNEISNEVTKK